MDPTAFLDNIAAAATAQLPYTVSRMRPRDVALTWKADAVHPLQILETEYQGIVRGAGANAHNLEDLKRRQGRALSDFFMFDTAPPRLLGPLPEGAPPWEALPPPENWLKEANVRLTFTRRELDLHVAAIPWPRFSAHLAAVQAALLRTCAKLLAGPADARIADVSKIQAALLAFDAQVSSAQPARDAITRLGRASELLEVAATGPASVQMIYLIETFYLFRLLVRYRADFAGPLDERQSLEAATQASRVLTGLLNNNYPWLQAWLQAKVVELGRRVREVDEHHILFFLKGGRAFQYLMSDSAGGQNDWDTQILINPYLEPRHWYRIYRDVSNAVLRALTDFRLEFGGLIRLQPGPLRLLPASPSLPQQLEQLPSEADGYAVADEHEEDGPPQQPNQRTWATCKAELIDVSLPRYDTVEALEQWDRLHERSGHKGILTCRVDSTPFPGPGYYIDEYVLMVRDVFTNRAPNPDKLPTRLARLRQMLELPRTASVVAAALRHLPALPNALETVRSPLVAPPVRDVLIVLLAQFAHGYGLGAEPSLTARFDKWFAAHLPQAENLARYPLGLRELIAPDDRGLGDAIGYCQWVSERMEQHLRAREGFVLHNEKQLKLFLEELLAKSFFRQKEELEVQLALRGSFAARLQTEYAFFRPRGMDPVTYMSLGLYSARRDGQPWYVLQLLDPIVNALLQADGCPFTRDPGVPLPHPVPEAHALRLYWAKPVTIEPFTYNPLAIELAAAPPPSRPLLSYVWGFPTLSLRDMVREYRTQAAETEEHGRRVMLRNTAEALGELMTRTIDPPHQRSKL